MDRTVYRTCTLCEACCGIEVHVEGNRIRDIKGDSLDPLGRGYFCVKARALRDLHEDPDRLRHPIRRTGNTWQRISWEEAFACTAEGIARVQREHGRDAVAFYSGEPVTHNLGAALLMDELVAALGTRKRFSANSLDQFPKQLVSHWMYGSGIFLSVPDVDRTSHMLLIGANPLVSNGSLMTAPGMPHRLRRIQERGGRIIVIDPRRSETAQLANEHHFVRPGTDPLLIAALVNTIITEGRVRMRHIGPLAEGLDTLREVLAGFTPEAVAGRVRIAPETIRSMAAAFADAPSAVCYGRMGTSTVRFGTTASWLIEVLNILTGNLDRPGGAMFPNPPVDLVSLQGKTGRGRWHSRVSGTAEFMGELPAATLAEEIEKPGEGQVRALVTLAGNPVLSSPAGHRLGHALGKLDFMLSIDFYQNETTGHANLVLPPVGPLERDHFDVVFQLFSVRNVPRWSPAVFAQAPDARSDAEIMLELASRLRWARGLADGAVSLAERGLLRLGADRVCRLVVDLALRTGPHGSGVRFWKDGITVRRLRDASHGVDLGPMESCLPGRLPAESKKINLAPPDVLEDLVRLKASTSEADEELLLVGRREVRTVNSWSHNLPSLLEGRERCVLHLHPADADVLRIEDGARVTVTSRVGAVEVPVRLTQSMMPGVVSLPHGYGHGAEHSQMSLAAEHAGASMNDLTDPAEIDPLSGTAVLSGVPVRVEPSG